MNEIVKPLAEIFEESVSISPGFEIIKSSWKPGRSQYLADIILDYVPDPGPGDRHLGVLDVDVFAEGLNFIFGVADAGDKKALISITRLKQEFYGLPSDEIVLRERILKEAIHELGHTYGFKHCPNSRCVMHFSNTLKDTDIKSWQFCPLCRRRLIGYINNSK